MKDLALGFGFAVRAADFDDDGDLDVYVANDSDPNYLYRNDGRGRFKEVGVPSFAAFDANGAAQASMGIATGDVDGDGILDLFVTNFSGGLLDALQGPGRRLLHGRQPGDGRRPADATARSPGARRWPTSTTTATSTSWSPTATSTRRSTGTPRSSGTYRQRNLLLENRSLRDDVPPRRGAGAAVPRRHGAGRPRLPGPARRTAAWPWGTSTTTAAWTS